MNGTYIKVNGVWEYLYRAVDKYGKTVEILVATKREMGQPSDFTLRRLTANGSLGKVSIYKSGIAAIDAMACQLIE